MSPIGLVRRLFGGGSTPSTTAEGLHLEYQPQVDLLFAWVGEPQQAFNVEVEPGVYVRVVPESKTVVGIEILDCAARFEIAPEAINHSFAEAKLQEYSAPALALLRA